MHVVWRRNQWFGNVRSNGTQLTFASRSVIASFQDLETSINSHTMEYITMHGRGCCLTQEAYTDCLLYIQGG